MDTLNHLINGKNYEDAARTQDIFNPSLGKKHKKVALASKQTVELAISTAKDAFPKWRATPPAKRAQIMFKFKHLLEQNAEKIADLIGQEHGKIKHDALGEIGRGIENVEFACGIPQQLKGEFSAKVGPGIDTWSEFQPLGVVAGITPFNFPAMVPMWMFPLAIACGNTFVLKPSEKDPSSTFLIAKLLHEAGLPPGVFNVVNGDKVAVDTILNSPNIEAVSFVGSTDVAKYIYTTACSHGKRCQALGGAKNHAIVMPDADIENATNQIIGAACGSSGERCMALSVCVAIGDEIADKLVNKLETAMRTLKVGAYLDESNDFGPVISKEHQRKIIGCIDSAQSDGAKVIVDGRNAKVAGFEEGYYVGPTLLDYVTAEMQSYEQEIFGPVLQIVRVKSMAEAMALIDNHRYGNGSSIFTRDGEAARFFSDHIKVGMVGINVPLPVPVSYHSFGGWKQSLFGDLYAYGPDGIRFYTRRKTITQRWPSPDLREKISLAFPN